MNSIPSFATIWRSEGRFDCLATLYDKNGLALYEGTITWGDYNKRRKEIADSVRDEFNQIFRAK